MSVKCKQYGNDTTLLRLICFHFCDINVCYVAYEENITVILIIKQIPLLNINAILNGGKQFSSTVHMSLWY